MATIEESLASPERLKKDPFSRSTRSGMTSTRSTESADGSDAVNGGVPCGVRWIVDGMNVIGSRPDGWWKDRHGAMVALVDTLDRWASETGGAQGEDVTVVFERPPSTAIRSAVIEVAHAPTGGANSADDEIVRLVQANPRPTEIRVVTSDKALSERVRNIGASVYRAEGFRDLIDPRGTKPGGRHAD